MKRGNFNLIGLICVSATFLLTNCGNDKMKIKTLPYPDTHYENIADDYHGVIVEDPYRWLENENSPETKKWIEAQNTVTFDYLNQIPYRDQIRKRLTELHDYPCIGAPSKHGDWYYTLRNNGLQNQNVLYRQSTLDAEPELFLDPNKLSENGTVALVSTKFSKDGKYFAYSVSESGSDWVVINVMNTETKENTEDIIKWVKFSGAEWDNESKGFYYSRYDEPTENNALSGANHFQKVYYHRLGTSQSSDVLIYQDKEHPKRYLSGQESQDGKYIFIIGSEGTSGNEVLYREKAKTSAPFQVLLAGFEYNYDVVFCKDDVAYLHTNDGHANYQIAKINLQSNKPVLRTVIKGEHYLNDVSFTGRYIFTTFLEHASSVCYQYDMDGQLIRKIDTPLLGSISGFAGKDDEMETFYTYTSFTAPSSVYRYDIEKGQSELLSKPEVNFDESLFVTKQIFFTSNDGAKVPMFVTHRKDLKLNGENTVYLYGYGGFRISRTPSFNASNIMFLEQGGIYALVNLRGGNEYGEQWHKDGMLDNKQNVFNDFIAAAEYFVDNGYSNKSKIAISGGSNGGLLVGACMTQRPDLYAVAIPQVGVLDMLRYHLFTVGWGWAVEYGSSDDPEQFKYIYAYSPLHNIKDNTCYPATLVMTADHDDRVVPAHSFKFAATLQKAQGCNNPALIRIDSNAGHGAGKPKTKLIEDATDMYSFMFWNTETKVTF